MQISSRVFFAPYVPNSYGGMIDKQASVPHCVFCFFWCWLLLLGPVGVFHIIHEEIMSCSFLVIVILKGQLSLSC